MKQAVLDTSEMDRLARVADEVFPRVLPAEWRRLDDYANAASFISADGIRVIIEIELHGSHGEWLHVSFSRRDKTPSYFDMCRVKRLFVGKNRKAIQVLPAEEEHFNLHPHCLHIWSPLGADPLPDFRREDGGL